MMFSPAWIVDETRPYPLLGCPPLRTAAVEVHPAAVRAHHLGRGGEVQRRVGGELHDQGVVLRVGSQLIVTSFLGGGLTFTD